MSHPEKLTDAERFRFYFGPYCAPRVQIGDRLECEIRGELVVGRWSGGPITWPQAKNPKGGGWMLIVCDDLARAVRQESNIAVAHHFGGNVKIVAQWRKALGVGASTRGTQELRRAWVPFMLTEEGSERGRQNGVGSPARHVARPERCKANLKTRHPNARQWKREELALLGQISDVGVASKCEMRSDMKNL